MADRDDDDRERLGRRADSSGWITYERHVLAELKRLNDLHETLSDRFAERMGELERRLFVVQLEVARLQVKAGVWGGLAGLVVTMAAVLFSRLK